MNKNTLIGSILIAVIVIWWMAVNKRRLQPVPHRLRLKPKSRSPRIPQSRS